MAEQDSEKTEAPTPRRRQEARENGQIARSNDLSAAVLLLCSLLLLQLQGRSVATALKAIMQQALSTQQVGHTGAGETLMMAGRWFGVGLWPLVPILLGLMVIAVLINGLQVGFEFKPNRLMPKLESLSPIKGAKRIFGAPATAVQTAFNLVKMTIVGLVGYSAVHGRLQQVMAITMLDQVQAWQLGGMLVLDVGIRIAVALLILAILDYAWQRYRLEKQLKMTKQEVKDEMRSMDGDPMIKMRRRQFAAKMLKDKARQDVPTADVVVTNPTEYAIAIKYDATSMRAPRVIAKGRGVLAAEIRRIAVEHGIPIIERKPLARALYRSIEVGQEIPEEFYATVAEILAYVYELTGRLRKAA